MDHSEKTENKPLLEMYADAQKDVMGLQILLKAYTDDESTAGLGMAETILRSIHRAETEAYEIRRLYEDGGLR